MYGLVDVKSTSKWWAAAMVKNALADCECCKVPRYGGGVTSYFNKIIAWAFIKQHPTSILYYYDTIL